MQPCQDIQPCPPENKPVWSAATWYSHTKADALGYSPCPAREALIETISWLAASPHITREIRTNMHLSPAIYHFRSARLETLH